MELRHIRYFLAVAEEGHFTRAAAKVGIGQPPLSQQIKDLEEEVGARLFRRLPHGAELTPAGHAFLADVRGLPAATERATRSARRAARGESGAIRVGFTASSAFNAVVPAAIRTFRRAYPDVDLRLEEANTTTLVAALLRGDLDAVFLRPGGPGTQDLAMRVLSEEPLIAALPRAHPAAGEETLSLPDLRDDPFLLFPRPLGPTLFDAVVGACRAAGFEPLLGQTAPQIASIVNLVAAELGVSLVPASMAQLAVAGVAYRPLREEGLAVPLAIAHRRGDLSPIVRNFVAASAT